MEAAEAWIITFPAHYDAPMRQLLYRAHGEPSAPIEKLPLFVAKLLPHSRRVIDDAAVEREVVAASDDLERIKLQILHRAHRAFSAALALPSAARPQALSAENESTSCDARERDDWHTERRRLYRRWRSFSSVSGDLYSTQSRDCGIMLIILGWTLAGQFRGRGTLDWVGPPFPIGVRAGESLPAGPFPITSLGGYLYRGSCVTP